MKDEKYVKVRCDGQPDYITTAEALAEAKLAWETAVPPMELDEMGGDAAKLKHWFCMGFAAGHIAKEA